MNRLIAVYRDFADGDAALRDAQSENATTWSIRDRRKQAEVASISTSKDGMQLRWSEDAARSDVGALSQGRLAMGDGTCRQCPIRSGFHVPHRHSSSPVAGSWPVRSSPPIKSSSFRPYEKSLPDGSRPSSTRSEDCCTYSDESGTFFNCDVVVATHAHG